MTEFPRSLKYSPSDLNNSDINAEHLYIRMFLQLESAQNVFFTERLLLRHGQHDEGDLLVISFSIVSLTVKMWTHKDKFMDPSMRRNFEWIVS
jgi:hypothetical protein